METIKIPTTVMDLSDATAGGHTKCLAHQVGGSTY